MESNNHVNANNHSVQESGAVANNRSKVESKGGQGGVGGDGGNAANRDFYKIQFETFQIGQIINNLPKSEITEKEMKSPNPKSISGPDGSYTIDSAPEGWIAEVVSLEEHLTEVLGITDRSVFKNKFGDDLSDKVLLFKSNREVSFIPTPGQTLINDREFFTALEMKIPTKLIILPIYRVQEPLYIERSLNHNFLSMVGYVLRSDLLTLYDIEQGVIEDSQRQYIMARCKQIANNVTVNKKTERNVALYVTIIGIEGEFKDHMLMLVYPLLLEAENTKLIQDKTMNYPILSAVKDPMLEEDFSKLLSLIRSFRPLTVVNPKKMREDLQKIANQKFRQCMMENGAVLFCTEFLMLILRLKNWDMDDHQKVADAIDLLKPFECFAKEINLQSDKLDELWNSLDKKDLTSTKILLKQIICELKYDQNSDKSWNDLMDVLTSILI